MATTNAVYTAHVTVTGGREGHATSSDGALNIDLQRPGGAKPHATNPEQLFAAGYAACFQSALSGVGHQAGVDTSTSTIDAAVSLLKGDDGYGLGVVFEVKIPGTTREQATELVEKAHQVCPYSNATRGNISFEFSIVD
jgi:osmotically inducible protein OsmC